MSCAHGRMLLLQHHAQLHVSSQKSTFNQFHKLLAEMCRIHCHCILQTVPKDSQTYCSNKWHTYLQIFVVH